MEELVTGPNNIFDFWLDHGVDGFRLDVNGIYADGDGSREVNKQIRNTVKASDPDAIVIGEHTEMLHRRGLSPEEATMTAAKVMFAPVLAASLTTIAAFFPILTIGNEVGRIIRELPLTIILVILASLAECFLVLPMHLRKALERMDRNKQPKEPHGFNRWFVNFRDTKFKRAVS